jgi:DNA-binding NarL/FixJ family response regulator
MSGLEALVLIKESQPAVRVVILSTHSYEEYVLRAMKLGAIGFIMKDAAFEELEPAIKAVNSGNIWVSRALLHPVDDLCP